MYLYPLAQCYSYQYYSYQYVIYFILIGEINFEYLNSTLLGEILSLNYPTKSNDHNASVVQRLDILGYEVGYRLAKSIQLVLSYSVL